MSAPPTARPVRNARAGPGREVLDAGTWALLVLSGGALTAAFVTLDLRLGTAAAPFTGYYRLQAGPASLAAPALAGAVLLAVRRGWHERLGWGRTLLLGYLVGLAWALALAAVDGAAGLAGPVTHPQEYLRDVAAVGEDPGRFLREFVARSAEWTVATRQHPPGPVLLLWGLRPLGLSAELLGLLITLIGCLTVPLVAASVRSLCGEPAARRLLPLLALAPWAVWTAVSLDGVTSTVCAAMLLCGVIGSESGRSPWWAGIAGLLLGSAALLSYSAAWLAATLLATYFLRRRPLLIVLSGIGALVPLGLARLAGFDWADGLTAAQTDFSVRVGPERSWLLWLPLALLILAMACGPALWSSLRKVRNTPGWPFLVGAGMGVGFALVSGLSRGEVERSWLPFFPWLLVAAVAPEVPGGPLPRTPVLLAGLAAAAAVVLQAVLATQW